MKQIRKRITYANVMSSIAVFLVLGGATAFAATKIGSNEIKSSAITTGKIKKNAVTTAKIKKNAVTTAKIKNGAVTGAKINVATTPFSRVVAKLRGTTPLALSESLQVFPLSPSTYTQGGEENNTYVGAVDVTFDPACEAPRSATALVTLDAPDPTNPGESGEKLVGLGVTSDKAGGSVNKRMQVGPYLFFGNIFEPGAATTHTVNLVLEGECNSGSGITATFGGVDVIGTK